MEAEGKFVVEMRPKTVSAHTSPTFQCVLFTSQRIS
jgi:hypothetical protein